MRHYDKTLANLAVDYIQGSYKFEDILSRYNIKTPSTGLGKFMIACPFHNDKGPSLGINTYSNVFNCLGCGEHGNLVDFIVSYETKVLHNKTSFTAVLEKMLREDPVMQLRVGAKSIFKNNRDEIGLDELKIRRSVSFREVKTSPQTYPELSRFLRDKYRGHVNLLLVAIDYKEKGMSPEEIYNIICDYSRDEEKHKSTEVPLNQIDLMQILSEDDD